jgi:hypothetical protein
MDTQVQMRTIGDSRTGKRVSILILVLVSTVLLVSLLSGPIRGYYRSHGATDLDGESKGYIHLMDGQVYVVNVRKHNADVLRLGHYVSLPFGQIMLIDEINTNVVKGKVTMWGIWWENKSLYDRFMFRVFSGNMDRDIVNPQGHIPVLTTES